MRKFIDIINEFQALDPEKFVTTDGGDLPPLPPEEEDDGEGSRRNGLIMVFDILWDTDDADHLPTKLTIPIEELDDVAWPSEGGGPDGDMMTRIGDWLTDNVHGALSNFDYKVI